jgi:DNA-binding transcriptional LysR family regulator
MQRAWPERPAAKQQERELMARGVDVRHLRYFVAVAEELHFGRAAARLHISAPPLSQRVRELERALGFPLFERTSRSVTLTAAGERLLADARDVLRAMDRFEGAAAELAARPAAATWTVGYCHGSEDGVMRTLRAFRVEHPDVTVRPDGLTSLRILDGLRAGRIAAGIVRGPVAEPGRLASVPLARVPVDHLAVPPDHRLAEQAAIAPRDLDGEPVLVVERADAPTAHDDIESYLAAGGAQPRWVPHAAVQVERILDLVAVGTGIGWLNAWQAPRVAGRGDVAVRPLHPVGLYDEFRVAWRTGDASAMTAAFVRIALETCAA